MKKKINELLLELEDIYKSNRLDYDTNTLKKIIYSSLIYYGYNECNFEKEFDDIIKFFENKKNIECFKDNYYLKFSNGTIDDNKAIKLYIPIKYHFINTGIKILFSYLEENNIENLSLISKTNKCDSIIIKVNSIKDVNKIIDFINSNKELTRYLDKINNPFIYNYKNIGISLDKRYSYNLEVSKSIYNYLANRNRKHVKTEPNIDEYIDFLKNSYNFMLNKDDYLKDIYLFIINLLENNLNDLELLSLIMSYQKNDRLLMDALLVTESKHLSSEQVVVALNLLLQGDIRGITRKNDYRNLIYKYLDIDSIKVIINKINERNLDSEINNEALGLFIKKLYIYKRSTSYLDSIVYALKETLNKNNYDDNFINLALKRFFILNDESKYNVFTRCNDARNIIMYKDKLTDSYLDSLIMELKLKENTSIDEVIEIIKKELKK